jgi:microcystin degradation protein MlrC
MTNEVFIPNSDADTAVLLLDAAEKKEQDPGVVRLSTAPSGYWAPEDVAKAAGVDYREDDSDEEFEKAVEEARKEAAQREGGFKIVTLDVDSAKAEAEAQRGDDGEQKPAAKKTPAKAPAKKTAAKKAPAKKAAAKKSTSKES